MSINTVQRKDIPENSFVVRIKGTNKYIHIVDGFMSIKPFFIGCYVFRSKESAEDMIEVINDLEEEYTNSVNEISEFEVISFKDGYNNHANIEKQIFFN